MLYYRYLLLFRLGWMRLIVLFCGCKGFDRCCGWDILVLNRFKLETTGDGMVGVCSFIVYLFYLTARDLIICLVFEPIIMVILDVHKLGILFTSLFGFGEFVCRVGGFVYSCCFTEGYAVVFGVGLLSFLRRWLVCYVYVKLGQLLREIVIYLLYVVGMLVRRANDRTAGVLYVCASARGALVLTCWIVCFTRESCMRSSWRLMLLRELGFVGYIFLVIPVIKLVGCYVNYFLAIVGQVDFRVFCIIVNGGIGTCYAAGDLQIEFFCRMKVLFNLSAMQVFQLFEVCCCSSLGLAFAADC
eukprot:gene13208-9054_t